MLVASTLFAQKEVFFNEVKSEDIKVKSLHGFEMRLVPLSNSYLPYPNFLALTYPLSRSAYVGCFYEQRIASFLTVTPSIGLNNVMYSELTGGSSSMNNFFFYTTDQKSIYTYAMELELGIEPRFYLDNHSRQLVGGGQLNSGWFLSFPIALNSILLQKPYSIFQNSSWIQKYYSGLLTLSASLGYRRAISKSWFLEASVGLGSKYYLHKYSLLQPDLNTQCILKAGYSL